MHWQAIPHVYDSLDKNIFTHIISGEVFNYIVVTLFLITDAAEHSDEDE